MRRDGASVRGHAIGRTGIAMALGATALVVAIGASCSVRAAKATALRELAVGTWACVPDAGSGSSADDIEVEIGRNGTFEVRPTGLAESGVAAYDTALAGTWTQDGGDLRWSFDEESIPFVATVEAFDELTLQSRRFTMTADSRPGADPVDPSVEGPGTETFDVKAHGTDSVTFSVVGGDPWTCTRR